MKKSVICSLVFVTILFASTVPVFAQNTSSSQTGQTLGLFDWLVNTVQAIFSPPLVNVECADTFWNLYADPNPADNNRDTRDGKAKVNCWSMKDESKLVTIDLKGSIKGKLTLPHNAFTAGSTHEVEMSVGALSGGDWASFWFSSTNSPNDLSEKLLNNTHTADLVRDQGDARIKEEAMSDAVKSKAHVAYMYSNPMERLEDSSCEYDPQKSKRNVPCSFVDRERYLMRIIMGYAGSMAKSVDFSHYLTWQRPEALIDVTAGHVYQDGSVNPEPADDGQSRPIYSIELACKWDMYDPDGVVPKEVINDICYRIVGGTSSGKIEPGRRLRDVYGDKSIFTPNSEEEWNKAMSYMPRVPMMDMPYKISYQIVRNEKDDTGQPTEKRDSDGSIPGVLAVTAVSKNLSNRLLPLDVIKRRDEKSIKGELNTNVKDSKLSYTHPYILDATGKSEIPTDVYKAKELLTQADQEACERSLPPPPVDDSITCSKEVVREISITLKGPKELEDVIKYSVYPQTGLVSSLMTYDVAKDWKTSVNGDVAPWQTSQKFDVSCQGDAQCDNAVGITGFGAVNYTFSTACTENIDPGFLVSAVSPLDQLKKCEAAGSGGSTVGMCDKLGINFAATANPDAYDRAKSLNLKSTLDIAYGPGDFDRIKANFGKALDLGLKPILRICDANEARCEFKNSGTYIAFLNNLAATPEIKGREFYALAGPNEALSEGWFLFGRVDDGTYQAYNNNSLPIEAKISLIVAHLPSYVDDIVAGKPANVKTIFPSFNTDYSGFSNEYSQLQSHLSKTDFVGLNVYNVSGKPRMSEIVSSIAQVKPFILTEIGMYEAGQGVDRQTAFSNLINEIIKLRQNGSVHSMLLFNSFGLNSDQNFSYNVLTESEFEQIAQRCKVGTQNQITGKNPIQTARSIEKNSTQSVLSSVFSNLTSFISSGLSTKISK